MRKTENLEPYDPSRCCATCAHNQGHKCEMYQQKGVIIAFNHRLVRCNWFDPAETDTRAAIPNGSYRAVSEGVSHTHSDFDERGPDRDEWKHQAAQWQRIK